jgi:hypothetical protein
MVTWHQNADGHLNSIIGGKRALIFLVPAMGKNSQYQIEVHGRQTRRHKMEAHCTCAATLAKAKERAVVMAEILFP